MTEKEFNAKVDEWYELFFEAEGKKENIPPLYKYLGLTKKEYLKWMNTKVSPK